MTSYDSEYFLYLTPHASVSFRDNYAQKHGGAIFVDDAQDHYCCPDVRAPLKICFFAFDDISFTHPFLWLPFLDHCSGNDKYMNECLGQILTEGNFAREGGDTIFGGDLRNCVVQLSKTRLCTYEHIILFYNKTCTMSAALTQTSVEHLTKDLLNFVSSTYKVCACDSHKPNCKQRTINHTVYPGETVSIPPLASSRRRWNCSCGYPC